MPANQRLRSDDVERLQDRRKHAIELDEEPSVGIPQPNSAAAGMIGLLRFVFAILVWPFTSQRLWSLSRLLESQALGTSKEADRQRLLAYVTRLACADTDE